VAGFVYAYNNIKPFREFVNALWDDLKRFGSWLETTLSPIIKDLGNAFSSIGGAVSGITSSAHALHVPGFALGGIVPGAIGGATLAIVHGGETITPAGGAGRGGASSMATVEALLAQAAACKRNPSPCRLQRKRTWPISPAVSP
jgi:phage-related minor tail protein